MLESTPMITKKKLLGESSLSSLVASDRDLLLTQITITRGCDGEPDRTLTLSPQGLRDHFAALTMEHAREQPIEEATFERLARALQVELNEKLRFDICQTIIGTTLQIVRGWHGPRETLKVLKQLRHDAWGTMARGKDDRFIRFVVDMIQGEIDATGKPPREVINHYIEAMQEAISRGRPPEEEPRNLFFETIVSIAREHGDRLALPSRDSSFEQPPTSLFKFASAMRDLVVDYGNGILERRGLQRGRLDGFAELDQNRLIIQLEAARKRILQEIPMGSLNSPAPPNFTA
jgi:hypothetical protein